ncbi:hypothetical protein I350_01799 [Cryptococcus amylolentus CBS 6273]|uniref:Uncharacterized protein n=1 Tax=Cryptococcus amylolentus CBS 6273 TaxID=1296118 RepID=A0A1E3KDV6_9TREE|nr:hypothetical protein I350_01799 [Cryptococcus amylolentus CBS 6273]
MGTEGLIGYILRNKQRKAMYNQWDSYPRGQGYAIALFISRLSHEQAKEMADLWIEDMTVDIPKDIQKRYLAFDGIWKHKHPYGGPEHWHDEWAWNPKLSEKEKSQIIEEEIEEARKMLEDLPSKEGCEVLRDNMRDDYYVENIDNWFGVLAGADLGHRALRFIQEGKLKHLIDMTGYTEMECDWSYYIDFDHEKMEVWLGSSRLVREVTFDTLREDPEYMCKADFSLWHGEKTKEKRRRKTNKPRSHY